MVYYILKIVITTILIVVISEISKRSSFLGSILASIPLVSVLAMIWLYVDTKDIEKISALSTSIFWLVLPSLALFTSLPILLKKDFGFYPAMGISIGITVCCYYLMIIALGRLGITL